MLGAFLPFWLLAALFPSRISARAYELPASHIWEYEAAHSSSSSSGAVFTPAVVRIRAQQAAQTHPLATMLSQVCACVFGGGGSLDAAACQGCWSRQHLVKAVSGCVLAWGVTRQSSGGPWSACVDDDACVALPPSV